MNTLLLNEASRTCFKVTASKQMRQGNDLPDKFSVTCVEISMTEETSGDLGDNLTAVHCDLRRSHRIRASGRVKRLALKSPCKNTETRRLRGY